MGIKSTLDSQGIRPQKKWGQHFLTDARILESIADAGDVTSMDTILEIGPGLGHLTRVLARRAGRVVAVEIDAELADKLRLDFADAPNVEIVRGSILDVTPIEWLAQNKKTTGTEKLSVPDSIPVSFQAGRDFALHSFKIIANLPYYITSAILRHVLEAEDKPSTVVVMVQREVAQRIVARPPDMNLLAVSVQFFAQPCIVRTIAAGAFYPPPKVDSAVVRLDVLAQPYLGAKESAKFFEIARAGFSERRKQLRNSLAHGLALNADSVTAWLARAGIASTRRAETLTIAEWLRVCAEFR